MAALKEEGPNQFDLARKRAAQQSNSAVQGQQDALKRRFASIGSLNSGAAIKQNQLAAEKGQEGLAQANEGIDVAQANEAQRVREIQEGREFAKSERIGGQDFASAQADLQRKFASGERLSSQDFANLQRLGSQEFSSKENEANKMFQRGIFDLEQVSRDRIAQQQSDQFGRQMVLAEKQFEQDKITTEFNKRMAEAEAGKDNSIWGQIKGGYDSYTGANNPWNGAYERGGNYVSSRVPW